MIKTENIINEKIKRKLKKNKKNNTIKKIKLIKKRMDRWKEYCKNPNTY